MAVSVSSRCSTSTNVAARKTEVAHGARAAARPFTARRPSCAPVVVSSPAVVARPSSHITRVAAAEKAGSASAQGTQEWYGIVCNSEFFFTDPQNESIAEQLRERVRFFKEQNREIDLYLVPDPKWLDAKFPDLAKQVKRPCIALVSSDKQWITFMKLRIDRVAMVSGLTKEEALQVGGEVPDYKGKFQGKWTAPYAPYTPGWWNVFIPKH